MSGLTVYHLEPVRGIVISPEGSYLDKAYKMAVMIVESANYEDKITVRECSETRGSFNLVHS